VYASDALTGEPLVSLPYAPRRAATHRRRGYLEGRIRAPAQIKMVGTNPANTRPVYVRAGDVEFLRDQAQIITACRDYRT
jgi:hypothetical protein